MVKCTLLLPVDLIMFFLLSVRYVGTPESRLRNKIAS